MAKRTIRIRSFWWDEKDGDNTVRREAYRGQEVDLSAEDIERGERFNAFGDPPTSADVAQAQAVSGDAPFAQRSDADLERWIREDEPTVQEVVDASGGDPELANRLLAAEEAATGGDPRKGVAEGLAKITESA